MVRISVALLTVVLASTCSAWASGPKNVVRDCYGEAKVTAPADSPDGEIFVLVDETTVLDDNLKQEAIDRATNFLGDNRGFTVGRFSAFIQGRYADVVASGAIQKNLTEDQQGNLPRPMVATFNACRQRQIGEARKGIGYSMLQLMNGASNDVMRSDIMESLQMFSKAVSQSTARKKVVFVVSDMLENSSVISFYERNALRIVPDRAIKDAEKARMFGDFGGATVYVLGAATLAQKDRALISSYHDPIRLDHLKRFWTQWFEHSNARLAEFGMPALTIEIK